MVDGVSGVNGTNVQLRVGVHNIAEQGFATLQHQSSVVMTALLMCSLPSGWRTRTQHWADREKHFYLSPQVPCCAVLCAVL